MFSVYTSPKSQRFQIPPVCGAFTKSSVFQFGGQVIQIYVDGGPNPKIEAVFSNFSFV